MAITTTAVNACDVNIKLDDDAGAPQDISGSSNSVDMNFDQNLGDFVAFGEDWSKRLCCGKDASFSVNVIYSETADEGFDLLKNWFFGASSCASRTLTISIPDEIAGSDQYQAEVKLENLTWTADRGEPGPIMVAATLLPDGEVSWSTIAS